MAGVGSRARCSGVRWGNTGCRQRHCSCCSASGGAAPQQPCQKAGQPLISFQFDSQLNFNLILLIWAQVQMAERVSRDANVVQIYGAAEDCQLGRQSVLLVMELMQASAVRCWRAAFAAALRVVAPGGAGRAAAPRGMSRQASPPEHLLWRQAQDVFATL